MSNQRSYYAAGTACNLCGVTARMLDYWVTTEVIQPVGVFECDYEDRQARRRKAYHLFDYATLVQIKIVKDLRDVGLSLQRIRYAIQKLRKKRGKAWQAAWIVTDGRDILDYVDTPDTVESLAKGETGQLVFSVIALGATKERIQNALDRNPDRFRPFEKEQYRGTIKKWPERTISA